jgi:hypothetical protein
MAFLATKLTSGLKSYSRIERNFLSVLRLDVDRNVTIKFSGAQPKGLAWITVRGHEQASPVAASRFVPYGFGCSKRSNRFRRF